MLRAYIFETESKPSDRRQCCPSACWKRSALKMALSASVSCVPHGHADNEHGHAPPQQHVPMCRELTKSLLDRDFGIKWWIPDGQLIPPVPNRANYIHWLQDLLLLSSPAGDAVHECQAVSTDFTARLAICPCTLCHATDWNAPQLNNSALQCQSHGA